MNPTDTDDAIIKEIIIKAGGADDSMLSTLIRSSASAWWRSEGRFKATHMESDLRPGGAWLMSGSGMGGKPFTVRGEYRSIERARLLEFTWLADWHENPPLTVVRFDLTEKGGRDDRAADFIPDLRVDSPAKSYQGWPWLLAMLQAYLENKTAI